MGPSSLSERLRAWEKGRGLRSLCQWALTRKQTLGGGGALEVDDLRLVEDGSKRSSALSSDVVESETASKVMGTVREKAYQRALTEKANIRGRFERPT